MMDSLYNWMFGQLSINGVTLDLDSTVMTRYGRQEKVRREATTRPNEDEPAIIP